MCYECAAEPLVCSLSRQEVTDLNMQKPEHWYNEQETNDVDYAHTENEQALFVSVMEVVNVRMDVLGKSCIFVIDEVKNYLRRLENRKDQSCHLREKVHEEDVVVSDTDTIVDPWAVMVIPINARVANNAMSRSVRSYRLALRAKG